MPPRAKGPSANRPQTLREARRAYHKAGLAHSITAAQIRAAQRAAENDKRAQAILAKEKRAREKKRRKEHQEAEQRAKQRSLVQPGQLPEDSLWDRIRGSQQRLHSFFGAHHPEDENPNTLTCHPAPENRGLGSDVTRPSVDDAGAISPNRGCTRPSATANLVSTIKPPLPAQKVTVEVMTCHKAASVDMKHPTALRDGFGSSTDLDAQSYITHLPIDFELAEDAYFECKLNVNPLCEKTISLAVPAAGMASPVARPTQRWNKRRTICHTPGTPRQVKAAREVFCDMSEPNVDYQAHKRSPRTNPCPYKFSPESLVNQKPVLGIETASQIEAMFTSQDLDDDLFSDAENTDPLRPTSAQKRSPCRTPNKLPASRETPLLPPFSPHIHPRNHMDPKAAPLSPSQQTNDGFGNNDDSDDQSKDEFGGDVIDEIFKMVPQAVEADKAAPHTPVRSLSPILRTVRRPVSRNPSANRASPLLSDVRDIPYSTQGSLYELDGVDDQDLAGLTGV